MFFLKLYLLFVLSIGQVLHYSLVTGKKAMVVLIIENTDIDIIYFQRVKKLSEIYNFDVEYVTPKILNLVDKKMLL